MATKQELLNRGLPKWPQMLVTGPSLTPEQADEILSRTDTFITLDYSGNNHRFNVQAREALGMPPKPCPKASWEEQRPFWEADHKWLEQKTLVSTEYVHNSWISCSFVGGPHGWCHPDGKIGFGDNVGKWPDSVDILNDWTKIAKAFPFVEVGITLMSGESCENNSPVISFQVKGGKVKVVDPDKCDVHEGHEFPPYVCTGSENAIPLERLERWGALLTHLGMNPQGVGGQE